MAAGEPSPDQIIVCVGPTPIAGATYSHWLRVAEKSDAEAAAQARATTLDFLISSLWLKGEAVRERIHLTPRQVKRVFDRIRAKQFPRRREFGAFLRSSGQTIADLLFRVELNLLSTRIQAHVTAGHRGAVAQERALARFIAEFANRWRAMTYCSPQFAVEDCGHVQAAA